MFTVTKVTDLIGVIIPFFDKYPLESVKSIDYICWKKCVELMGSKSHLSQEGLDHIISILISNGKSLHKDRGTA